MLLTRAINLIWTYETGVSRYLRLKTNIESVDIKGKMFQFPPHTIAAVSTRNRIVEARKGFSSSPLKQRSHHRSSQYGRAT